MSHKAGFVNIIGRPNVGKSTLMNVLVGESLSIVTSKAQTTRHRILGIVNSEDYQIVYSDTPGILFKPQYELHEAMMGAVRSAFEDADVLLFITEIYEQPEEMADILGMVNKLDMPKLLLINKIDQAKEGQLEQLTEKWQQLSVFQNIIPISALQHLNISQVTDTILSLLPEHPAYYDKEQLTDRNERFFVTEIIREKILLNYRKEVPYSTEVVIDSFKEDEHIDRIRAIIFVERQTQKSILIGKNGEALKKVGIEARAAIEALVGKQVYLELHVKVKEGWRNDSRFLKQTGYQE
ncbi:MAG: GTPase Era [Chitinophagales bacterium]|nr:GTPase Era [Chitinophagales bacterium]